MRDVGSLGGTNRHMQTASTTPGRWWVFLSRLNTLRYQHAFITGTDGMGMRDLGTLSGDLSGACGHQRRRPSGRLFWHGRRRFTHAFITGPDGMGMRDLGTLGGDIALLSWHQRRRPSRGLFWHDWRRSTDAFITGPDGSGMMDLNSLVDAPGGLVLNEAVGINNSGQVVALWKCHPRARDLCALSCGPGPGRVHGAAKEDESCAGVGLGSGRVGAVAKHSSRMPMPLPRPWRKPAMARHQAILPGCK